MKSGHIVRHDYYARKIIINNIPKSWIRFLQKTGCFTLRRGNEQNRISAIRKMSYVEMN